MERAVNRPLLCAELIGRGPELAEIGRLLEQVRAGCGRVLLISGEAGVGKSRLIRELRRLPRAFGRRRDPAFLPMRLPPTLQCWS